MLVQANRPLGGYNIPYSLNFDGSRYMSQTFSTTGTPNKGTINCRLRTSNIGSAFCILSAGADVNGRTNLYIGTTGALALTHTYAGSTVYSLVSQNLFRDPAKFYDLTFYWDFPNGVCAFVLNGENIPMMGTAPGTGVSSFFFNNCAHYIGRFIGESTYSAGQIAEFHMCEGVNYTATDFGRTDTSTNTYTSRLFAGSFGTRGSRLRFRDGTSTTTLGYDDSGNGNHWTLNGFATTDRLADSPTNTFAILNSLDKSTGITISSGGLVSTTTTANCGVRSGFGIDVGRWYAEMTCTVGQPVAGLYPSTYNPGAYPGATKGWAYVPSGNKLNDGSSTAYGSSYSAGAVIGIAVDMDAGKVWFRKDGVWQNSGDPAAGTGEAFSNVTSSVLFGTGNSGQVSTATWNFGQRAFTYAPPSGFKTICTRNLPTPTIRRGDDAFDISLRTGAGTGGTVSGKRFAPDILWSKTRSNAVDHVLANSDRGFDKVLFPNLTNIEDATNALALVRNSDGYSFGSANTIDGVGRTFVEWLWRKGAAYGCDVVEFTSAGSAQVVNHSLGGTPDLTIIKSLTSSANNNWYVHHSAGLSPGVSAIILNSTGAATIGQASLSAWSASSVTTVALAAASYEMMAFRSIHGYSAFGSYIGNGSADGPFVWLGFKPAFVMTKRTDSIESWIMHDNKRDPYNVVTHRVLADSSVAEATNTDMDFLSGGFKLRASSAAPNINGGTYIYAAFAENPFKYANAA